MVLAKDPDLVKRLRACVGPWSDPGLTKRAADEIERLRSMLDHFVANSDKETFARVTKAIALADTRE